MASRIKGITIEIGADTTQLTKAMESTYSTISKSNTALRDINKLLKLDPTNTELISQKYRQLQTNIQATREKLSQLQDAEKQMQQKVREGKASQEQYDALKREIIATEQELRKLNNTVGSGSESLARMSANMEAFGSKASKAGDKLKPLSIAMGGLLTASVKIAADFEAGMSKVGAISGATAEDMAKLEAEARRMGESTRFSATEASEALTYMAMAGWKTEDMLSGLEGIMSLAAASGEDLATTSDIVTDALTAFGLAAEDSNHFADVLAAASSNANTNVALMGETFKYVAPVAGSLGYSIDDVAVAIGLMANAGIKGSQAGTSLRTILTNLVSPSAAAADAMAAVGVSLEDGEGNMKSFREVMLDLRSGFSGLKIPAEEFTSTMARLDAALEDGTVSEEEYNKAMMDLTERAYGAEGALKAQAAAAIGGQRGMSSLLSIVNASEEDFNKLIKAIDGSEGAAKSMAEMMEDNLAGELRKLKSQLEEVAIQLGKEMMPVIKDIVGGIQDFVKWFSRLDDSTKKTIVKFAALTAAASPVLKTVGGISSGLGKLVGSMSKAEGAGASLRGGLSKLWGVVAAHPFAAVAGVIGTALIPAIWEYIDGTHEAEEAAQKLIDSSKEYIANAEEQANRLGVLQSQIEMLNAEEELSVGQKALLASYVKDLNEAMGDTIYTIDEETGHIIENTDAVRLNIEAMQEQIRVTAYREQAVELAKEQAMAEMALAETQANLAVTTERINELQAAGAKTTAGLNTELTAEDQELIHLLEDQKLLQQQEEDQLVALANLTNETNKYSNAADSAGNIQEYLTQTLGVTAQEIPAGLLKALQEGQYKLPSTVQELNDLIMWQDAIDNTSMGGTKMMQELDAKIRAGKTTVGAAMDEIDRRLKSPFDSIGSSFAGFGDNVAQGLANGIRRSMWLATSAAADMASATTYAGKSSLAIASPSKIWDKEIGQMLDAGLAQGLRKGIPKYIDPAIDDVESAAMFSAGESMKSGYVAAGSSMGSAVSGTNEKLFGQLFGLLAGGGLQIVLENGVLVGQLAPAMNNELGRLANMERRGA